MQTCNYCGRGNEDEASICCGCGTSLREPPVQVALATPHHMMGAIQRAIWDYFALKRGQFYLAGFLIGAFGGLCGAAKHGFDSWMPALVMPVLGVGAVGLVTLLERWQARLNADRVRGRGAAWKNVLFVLGGLLAFLAVALAFAGFVFLFIK